MKSLLVLLLGLSCAVPAQTLHFGTNVVVPGKILEFTVPLNARAKWEASRIGQPASIAKGALVLPAGVTNLIKPCPLLIVSVPSGGSAIRWLPAVTNIAWAEGWAVLAADGPKVDANDDTIQFGWAVLSSVLEQFTRLWPAAKQWPAACGGFSGGAKRSAAVGAAMTHDGWHVIGVFMGGCNEDRATLGLKLFASGPAYKRVPMFLSNGDQDPIANPEQGAAVRDAMLGSGFTTIRMETYAGGHRFEGEHLRVALRWFRQLQGKPAPVGR